MSTFDHVGAAFLAAEKGAAACYHSILATGVQIAQWEASHPTAGPLINEGLAYAVDALVRFGVPSSSVTLTPADISAALRSLAALDATVPSASTVTTTVTSQTPISAVSAEVADQAAHVIPTVEPLR